MTETDVYDGGVTQADFPPEPETTSGPPPADADAPYGYTRDKDTGGWRPKLRSGRPKLPPSPDEVAAGPPPPPQAPDRPPQAPPRGRRPEPAPVPPPDDVPMPKGGEIARFVNKYYRRAGRLTASLFDQDIGNALAECATPDPDGDWPTTGEAWENLARVNPRIRAFIVRAMAGGAWTELFMAHAPLGMAIVMKPAIQRRLPLSALADVFFTPDEDSEDGTGPGGLTPEDAQAMMDTAGITMDQAAAMAAQFRGQPGGPGGPLTPPYVPHDLPPSDGDIPAGLRPPRTPQDRQQPRAAGSRARRKGGR